MSKPAIFKIYAVHGGGDDRSIGPIEGYCKTMGEADVEKRGRGWYGGDKHVSEAWAMEIDGKTYVLAKPEPIEYMDAIANQKRLDDELRQRTLAALTPEQRRVLGV